MNLLWKISFIFVTSCILFQNLANSIKILTIVSTPSKSHWITIQNLVHELVKSGHELTVISPYPLKNPPKNYHDISIVESIEEFKPEMQDGLYDEMNLSIKELMDLNFIFCHRVSKFLLEHPNVVKLMKSNETFDLIILESFMNDVLLGFHHYYNAPIISYSPMLNTPWLSYNIGNPMPISYVPHIFSEYTEKMTFKERFINAVMYIFEEYTIRTLFLPLQVRFKKS